MGKKSKFVLFLLILEFVLFSFSLLIYLLDTTSLKYQTTFIISSCLFAILLLCFIYIFIIEKRTLVDFDFLDYSIKLVNRDHYLFLRELLEEKEMDNSNEEAELLKKYEEIAIEYERKGRFYLVFSCNNPIALIEVNRDFKNKTISFNDVCLKVENVEKIHEEIANKNKMVISK